MSTKRKARSRRKPVVVAVVRSEWLARVLRHLLGQADGLDAFVVRSGVVGLASEVVRLAPDVVVAALSSHGDERAAAIAGLQRAIGATTRVVWIEREVDPAAEHGPLRADALIREDAVVATLLPEIRRLTAKASGARRR